MCIDITRTQPYTQVGVGRVSVSGILDSVMVCTHVTRTQPHTQVGVGRVDTSSSKDRSTLDSNNVIDNAFRKMLPFN